MIQVQVKLYGELCDRRSESAVGQAHHPFAATLPPETKVDQLLNAIGIERELVNGVIVNGQVVDRA